MIETETKRCIGCKKTKPLEEFNDSYGLYWPKTARCSECLFQTLPAHRRYNFGGLTHTRKELFQLQGERCAICGRKESEFKRKLGWDHNHHTNENRGLLCFNCNTVIGKAGDCVELLQKAIEYLDKYSGGVLQTHSPSKNNT